MAAYGAVVDHRTLLSVAAGGVAGASLRWAIGDAIDDAVVSLIVVNAAGAFILGLLVHRHRGHPSRPQLWLGIGFCGALTTFSTLAVEVAARLERGDVADGLATLVITVATGLIAALAGNLTGRVGHRSTS